MFDLSDRSFGQVRPKPHTSLPKNYRVELLEVVVLLVFAEVRTRKFRGWGAGGPGDIEIVAQDRGIKFK